MTDPVPSKDQLPEGWISISQAFRWIADRLMVKTPEFVINNWDCKYINARIDMRTGNILLTPGNARAVPEPGALQAEVDRMRKLFWLAKEDVIFFSGYDQRTDSWPEIDLFYTPCVTVNDTFGYACADAERLDDSEIDRLIDAHKRWGYDGVVAWASLIRKCEPIEPRRTPKYREAREVLESGTAQPPRDGQ